MTTNTDPVRALRRLAERAVPFLRDEAATYDDDGSNEPLELARDIESLMASLSSGESALPSANSAFDGGREGAPCPHARVVECDCANPPASASAPPSAPVGVEQSAREAVALSLDVRGFHQEAHNVREGEDLDEYRDELLIARIAAALAQQPAAPSGAVNVVGMPEFDGLLDHIYEYGTAAEGVIGMANAFARAVLARYAPQQPAAVDGLAARLVDELDGLVGESGGVYGLHLNGDVATWEELLPGGRFERLSSLDELRAALAAQQQGGRDDGFAANRQEGE